MLQKTKTAADPLVIEKLLKEKHPEIDRTFFAEYLEGLKIEGQSSARIEYLSAVNWYFIDHRDLKDYIVFSILDDNESGYNVMYHLVYSKKSRQINSVSVLTTFELDGGAYGHDSLVWSNNAYTAYSSYENEEEKDSMIYRYVFRNGKFESKELFFNSQKLETK
ncbi:MAG: hypothetical protein ACO1O6_13450 [Bacteroidota bacterium]